MYHIGFWQSLMDDLSGKGQFRLILQPMMAIALGIRFGIIDAKEGSQPFVLRMLTTGHMRWQLFKRSLEDALKPLLLALAMDAFFQYLAKHHVRPLQAVLVGAMLVWFPFVVSRALANRAWTRSHRDLTLHPKR